LEQQVRAAMCPLHLLFREALAQERVDERLDERGGDDESVAVASEAPDDRRLTNSLQ
jgi:hypothetical protein